MKNFYCFLFLLACSCTEKSSEKNDFLRVALNLDDSIERNLSEKFEDIRYVLLDYSDSLPLVNPYIIRFTADKIFVSDRVLENILIFDSEGNYLDGLFSTGEGPGEFIQIEDFQLNEDFIFFQDNRLRKILKFTLEGEFIEERKNLIPSSNTFLTDEFELHFMNNFLHNKGFNFIRKDKQSQDEVEYYEIPKELAGLKTALKNGFLRNPQKDEILLGIPNSNKIAFFNSNGFLSRELEIDLGSAGIDNALRSNLLNGDVKYSFLNEANLSRGSSAFYPFKNDYFAFFQRGGKEFHYVFFDENFNTTFQAKKLKNDLDGMIINNVPWSLKKDELVFMIDSNNFLKNYFSKEDELKSDFPSKMIHEFVSGNSEKLKAEKTVLVFLKVR
jgi:hypothetical protein